MRAIKFVPVHISPDVAKKIRAELILNSKSVAEI